MQNAAKRSTRCNPGATSVTLSQGSRRVCERRQWGQMASHEVERARQDNVRDFCNLRTLGSSPNSLLRAASGFYGPRSSQNRAGRRSEGWRLARFRVRRPPGSPAAREPPEPLPARGPGGRGGEDGGRDSESWGCDRAEGGWSGPADSAPVRHDRDGVAPTHRRRCPQPASVTTVWIIIGSHGITSSARPSSAGGMVRPSALAVFRLITNSKRVGRSIGSSPGRAPLRILPANDPRRRHPSTRLGP